MGAPEVVVLDTNVLVSALGWKGPEHRVYCACRKGIVRMAISHALLTELERVLTYDKFDLAKAEIAGFLDDVCSHALIVTPAEAVDVIRDDADNRVLECALAAKARWVVSGDKDLLELHRFRGIRIRNASDFLDVTGCRAQLSHSP